VAGLAAFRRDRIAENAATATEGGA